MIDPADVIALRRHLVDRLSEEAGTGCTHAVGSADLCPSCSVEVLWHEVEQYGTEKGGEWDG